MRLPYLIALIACALALRPGPAAALGPRSLRFVFNGTVSQPNGRPMRGVEIRFESPKSARPALSDREGRFVVTAEIPDLRSIEREPARVALYADYRDWNIALSAGSSTLVIELRLVRSAGGLALEVRSNDAHTARTVASFLRTPGDAVIALSPQFVRQLGLEDRTPPPLAALERVPLGPDGMPVPFAEAPPLAADSLRPTDSSLTLRTIERDTVSLPPQQPTASLVSPSAPAPRRSTLPPSMRLFPSAPDEPIAPARPAPRDSAGLAPRRAPAASAARPRATATVTRAPDTTRAVPDTATRVAPRRRGAATPAVPLRPDTATRAPARPPRPPAKARPAAPILVSVRSDSSLAIATPERPRGAGSLRVAHGVAVLPPPARDPQDCGCEVRGTVEVMADRPLDASLRVAVWVADAPALADTVTLFMGSPRSFDLGRFPCGGHRLEIQPVGTRRFVVAAPPPSVFPCVEGMQPFRVILRPR